MNKVYREAFIFDCAMQGRKFYIPKDGEMKLQFFHVRDLCELMDMILEKKPEQMLRLCMWMRIDVPDTRMYEKMRV